MTFTASSRRARLLKLFILLYPLLLLASHLISHWRDGVPSERPDQRSVEIVDADKSALRMAYVELPGPTPHAPVVLLLHGSPARAFDLREVAQGLGGSVRVVAPDLPGFGNSTRRVDDYSIEAQARRVDAFLDALNIERAHIVGFSLGGGVAMELYARAPHRVASITLVASLGVQELELLGSYALNHALHGVQLAGLWLAANLVPHFGWLDRVMFNVPYARSFFDSDQRQLRGIMERCEVPVLILHGDEDPLVPFAAAREHHRIIPQSEMVVLPGAHFHVYTDPAAITGPLLAFVSRVERGEAVTRAQADPERIEAAAEPFGEIHRKPADGVALLVIMALIILSTLISEDLACIGAGLLVAHGLITFFHAASAAFVGIFVGDILLYLAGRYIGRPALRRAPFRWIIRAQAIEDSADWFARRGPIVILASRFVPGSRLPTYFTAGLLHQRFWVYLLYFFIAGAVWAPFLVWLAATLGDRAMEILRQYKMYTLGGIAAVFIALWIIIELLIPLCTFRGRRLLYGRWQRLRRSEFWPTWALYVPLIPWFAWLAMRYRGLTTFTAANPAMPMGGLVGESKSMILAALSQHAGDRVARHVLLPAATDPDAAQAAARAFLDRHRLKYPIVLKPDVGERGIGIAIAHDEQELTRYFMRPRPATLIQEYVPGREYGIFYFRRPNEAHGQIFAITQKEFPSLKGNGRHTLEELILRDSRAVCMASLHFHVHRRQLSWVPAAGESVPLATLGNHCRGAIFRDGSRLITPELSAAMDAISRGYDGFFIGRYDVRVASEEDLLAGRSFKIIELNGVSSEATSLYDPAHRVFDRWRILARQWQIACEIGAMNAKNGARVASLREVLDLVAHHRPAPEADE